MARPSTKREVTGAFDLDYDLKRKIAESEQRSSMILIGDINAAAELAALELAPFLLPEQVAALAQELGDHMHDFVRLVREREELSRHLVAGTGKAYRS